MTTPSGMHHRWKVRRTAQHAGQQQQYPSIRQESFSLSCGLMRHHCAQHTWGFLAVNVNTLPLSSGAML